MPISSARAGTIVARPYTLRELFHLLDRATLALGLPASVYRTAQVLIRFIPKDAPAPVSPARVQELAEILGLDPRTVRAHVRRLAALGLAEDRCLAGGHRTIRRRAGRIVALHGVDFTPLLTRRLEFEAEAARIELEQAERIRLRAAISTLRGRFRLLAPVAPTQVLAKVSEYFATLPRRYAHLPLAELAILRDRLVTLLAAITPLDGDTPDTANRDTSLRTSDRSEGFVRPPSSKDRDNPVLPLGSVLTGLPDSWREEIDRRGQRSWSALIATAHARSITLGIPQATWDMAVRTLGRREAALLMLAADADHIRCPAAWMRAVALRAAGRAPDLSRTFPAPRHQPSRLPDQRMDPCESFSA